MKSSVHAVFCCMLAAAFCSLAGCGKDKPIVDTGDPKLVVGSWIEVRVAGEAPAGNPRRGDAPKTFPTENLRKLTMNDGGTFKLELVTPAKAPVAGKAAEGNWVFKDGRINFEVKSNTLGDTLAGMLPSRGSAPVAGAEQPQFVITDESGVIVRMNRAQ